MTEIEPSSPFLYPDRLYEGYVFDLDASYDRGFEYRKLQIAFDAIWVHK